MMPLTRSTTPQFLDMLETPCALVDLDRLAHNLERMAAYCVLHGLALRPHVKTHKSPRIAAEQLRLGAAGLTCATPRELEVMSETSNDLLLAHPPIGAAKLHRVMSLDRDVQLTVAIDSWKRSSRSPRPPTPSAGKWVCTSKLMSGCDGSAWRRTTRRSPSRGACAACRR
jgi:D-serine deaminase-like pyridoxal phosphate-dependent protein